MQDDGSNYIAGATPLHAFMPEPPPVRVPEPHTDLHVEQFDTMEAMRASTDQVVRLAKRYDDIADEYERQAADYRTRAKQLRRRIKAEGDEAEEDAPSGKK